MSRKSPDITEASRARDLHKLQQIRKHTAGLYHGLPDAVSKYGHEAHMDGAHAREMEKSHTAPQSKKLDAHHHAEMAHQHAAERIKRHLTRATGDSRAAGEHPAVKLHRQGEQFHAARRQAMGDQSEALDPKDVELSRGKVPTGPKVQKDVLGRTIGVWKGQTEPASPPSSVMSRVRKPQTESKIEENEMAKDNEFRRLAGMSNDYEGWTQPSKPLTEGEEVVSEEVEEPKSRIRRLARLLDDGGFGVRHSDRKS